MALRTFLYSSLALTSVYFITEANHGSLRVGDFPMHHLEASSSYQLAPLVAEKSDWPILNVTDRMFG